MNKIFTLFLLCCAIAAKSTTWTVMNSGTTFTPANITINLGDDVNFVLQQEHNSREVSQSTWNMNGNTALPGGFETPFGGGLVSSSKLTLGTHWYVCVPHASIGMKGTIIVKDPSSSDDYEAVGYYVYPNPVSRLLTIRSQDDLAGVPYLLTDPNGKSVLNGNLYGEVSWIDLTALAPGVYIFQVSGLKKYAVKIARN
jgi:plastocyanin